MQQREVDYRKHVLGEQSGESYENPKSKHFALAIT